MAVKTALTAFNKAAQMLDPPRPTYEWEELSHYGFLQDCAFLRESHLDILAKPWVQPATRIIMRQFLRIRRAGEEIVRCNVELCCLHTSIIDKNSSLDTTLKDLQGTQDVLCGLFEEYAIYHRRINNKILARCTQGRVRVRSCLVLEF